MNKKAENPHSYNNRMTKYPDHTKGLGYLAIKKGTCIVTGANILTPIPCSLLAKDVYPREDILGIVPCGRLTLKLKKVLSLIKQYNSAISNKEELLLEIIEEISGFYIKDNVKTAHRRYISPTV